MAHKVNFSIPERQLGRADVEFEVFRDGSKFGTLKVSNGSLVWVPANHQRGHKVSWRKFDVWAQGITRYE